MWAAILALTPGWLKWAAVGLAGASLLAFGSYTVGKHEGRQAAAVDAAQAVSKAYKDRNDENSSVEALNAYSLCRELGGLLADCAELRRLGEDHGQAGNSGLSGRK
jgi:hypothetical protein